MKASKLPLRARRSFERLETRIAPSDTLALIGAAALAAESDTPFIDPPADSPAPSPEAWTPDETIVPLTIIPPGPSQITISPPAIDGLLASDTDLVSIDLGEGLGPDLPESEPTSPSPASPLALANGVGAGFAPGGSAAPGGGGGGGGGGGAQPDAALGPMSVNVSAADVPPPPGGMPGIPPLPPMPPPIANDDMWGMPHDGWLNQYVMANDQNMGATAALNSLPQHGQLSFDSGGQFVYTPNSHWMGIDIFTYHDIDVFGQVSNIATVKLVVGNWPPTAYDDYYTAHHDTPFLLGLTDHGVLFNDTDPDSSDLILHASLVQGPAYGTLEEFNDDGTFIYDPKPGFLGEDTFEYQAADNVGATSLAMVHINVTDKQPLAVDDGTDALTNPMWAVSWRKSEDVQSTLLQNVLPNDSDPDNDPLTPVLDSYPANGTLKLTKAANESWTGEFQYTPVWGFSGIDTFTYHVDDGALDSRIATVSIRVQKVDIDLYDGGNKSGQGALVPDDKELSRGAYAVANNNDTNGDGIPDGTQQPVTQGTDNKGYDEYDLMKLVIKAPDPVVPGFDKLTVDLSPGLDFWATSKKQDFPQGHPAGSPSTGEQLVLSVNQLVMQGPMTVYVEAVRQSATLKDMGVTATYVGVVANAVNVTDTIRVTGIWVEATSVTFDTETQAQVKAKYQNDMDQALLNLIPRGTGVLPSDEDAGTQNAIVFQFTPMPLRGKDDGTWEGDNIFFDVTRRVSGMIYQKALDGGDWVMDVQHSKPWPYMVEATNDDTEDVGDSPAVTPGGHLYAVDTPTIFYPNLLGLSSMQLLMNCREFVRVEIDAGQRVTGNGWIYSRGSVEVPWHSEIWVVQDPFHDFMRKTDGAGPLHNEIEAGGNDINNGYPF